MESEADESGLVIAGYYHAHDNIRDNHIDPFSQKIADKVSFDNILRGYACFNLI